MLGPSSFNSSQTVILAGSGRSGTTWLGNIIAANPNMRTIFEPFDHRRVPEAALLPLRPYARPQENYPEWASFVDYALRGQIENTWTSRQGKGWLATRLLVKAIRINLMLAWIDHHFRPKIVFTTRHPCAVILSRLKLKWETHIDVFLSQPQLISDYLEPFVDVILSAETELQKQAVMWSVENLVPLHQLPTHRWVFCTYEELYRDPEVQAKRVLSGLNIRKTWFTQRAITQISSVTRSDSAILNKEDPLVVWQNQLSNQEINEILTIVDKFGITLYSDDPMPHSKKPLVRDHPHFVSTETANLR